MGAERLLTQAELADVLPITTRQIRKLVKEGLPTTSLGRRTMYPLAECVAWYIEYREAIAAKRLGDLGNAKARKAVADADMAELKAGELRGSLIPAERYHAELSRILRRLADRVAALESSWAPHIVGLEDIPAAQEALGERAADLLRNLQADLLDESDRQAADEAAA